MRISDGKNTVNIYMYANGVDVSYDFFWLGDDFTDYDVDYCISQAKDWQKFKGDWAYDEREERVLVIV